MTKPDKNGWRPIETAPKNTLARLVWCPDRKNVHEVYWEASKNRWMIFGTIDVWLSETPTHWQPLPLPPKPPVTP